MYHVYFMYILKHQPLPLGNMTNLRVCPSLLGNENSHFPFYIDEVQHEILDIVQK